MYILRLLLLVLGVLSCSTAALMIRASGTPALLVAAYRLLIASALLSPLYFRARRRHPGCSAASLCGRALPAAVFLAAHFWSWNVSVRMTSIANASLIVNLVSVAMPFVIWIMVRERIGRAEILGTVLALGGTALLTAADYRLDFEHFAGDLLAFGSMLAFAMYLAWSRRAMHVPSIWLYVPPVYAFAGGLCLLAGGLSGGIAVVSPREWLLLTGLALVPTIVGHTLLNLSMRTLRSQLVAIVNLGQFIGAGLLAWLIFGERPLVLFPFAAALVVAGAVTAIRGQGPPGGAAGDEGSAAVPRRRVARSG